MGGEPRLVSCLSRGTTEEQTTPPGATILFGSFLILKSANDSNGFGQMLFFSKQTTPTYAFFNVSTC